jgi:hypothetical protein
MFLGMLTFLSPHHAAARLVHLDDSPSRLAREKICFCSLDKMHCRLDPNYPASFAAANSMSMKAAHLRHLEITSHQT